MPTDAEWSAAVGGNEYPWGNYFPPTPQDGNYDNRLVYDGFNGPAPVMTYRPNELGIFDMGGNALEWCSTKFTAGLNDAATRSAFPYLDDNEVGMVLRGGAWDWHEEGTLRSAFRINDHSMNRRNFVGFRCVLALENH